MIYWYLKKISIMSIPKATGKFNKAKQAADLFNNRKSLFQMLSDVFNGRYKMSFITSLILLLGLAYIILPFDFDWIPLIGWVDDGFVGYFVVKRLLKETQRYARYKTSKHTTRKDAEVQEAIIVE